MNILTYSIVALLLTACQLHSQSISYEKYVLDTLPIDTSEWSVTDTLILDFNKDGVQDIVLEFGKYHKLTRPEDILIPYLFYTGNDGKYYTFQAKGEHIIALPEYDIEVVDKTMIRITQLGIDDDYNSYITMFRYDKGWLVNESVVLERTKTKYDENTDELITVIVQSDTLYAKRRKIDVESYRITDLINKFGN